MLWQLKAGAGALSALPSLLDCISQSLSWNSINLGLLCKTCARLQSHICVWPCASCRKYVILRGKHACHFVFDISNMEDK